MSNVTLEQAYKELDDRLYQKLHALRLPPNIAQFAVQTICDDFFSQYREAGHVVWLDEIGVDKVRIVGAKAVIQPPDVGIIWIRSTDYH